MVLIGTATLLVMAAAVNATQPGSPGEPEKIAVCHATGSESNPWVFLMVRKDGYEHAFFRAHPYDFFPEDPTRGCQGDEVPQPPVPEPANNTTAPADNSDAPDIGDDGEDGSEEPAENATEPAPNGTVPDNATDDAGSGNGTAGNGTVGNATEEATTPPPPPGDAAVRQSAWQDDFEVVLTIEVRAVGQGGSQDVTLHDDLPDLRRTWHLGGADSADCTLSGRTLDCWFGSMAPGESATIQLRGYTDRMPCGFSLTNTAQVSAVDDLEARNNASSAGIAARAC